MRKDKEEVLRLRKCGKSYNEICEIAKIPKSTLSAWLGSHDWSKNITKSLNDKHKGKNTVRIQYLNTVRKKHLECAYEEAKKEAREEFTGLRYHPLFIAGLMLYWGEGDKTTKHNVTLANTDPAMIRLFVNFLMHVCQIEKKKIRLHLLLYPDLDADKCKDYWKNQSGLEYGNFIKSTTIKGRHKTKRLPYGVCNVTVTSSYLKKKMYLWLDLMPKALLDKQYYRADIV